MGLNRFGKLCIASYGGLVIAATGFFSWAAGVGNDLAWNASMLVTNLCIAGFVGGLLLSAVGSAVALAIPSYGETGRLIAAAPIVVAVAAAAGVFFLVTHLGIH